MASRPDRLFRIADRRHLIFDGTGAFLGGGRWNSPGRRIIYGADTLAGAMLEILAHTRIGKVPRTHAWVEARIPDGVTIEELEPTALPGWDSEGSVTARAFGDGWHEERRSLILLVPSVTTSGVGRNVLVNQDHSEFGLLLPSEARAVIWDTRLFEKSR